MTTPLDPKCRERLVELRAKVHAEYEKNIRAIDTLLNMTDVPETKPAKAARTPTEKVPTPKAKKTPRHPKPDGTMTLAEHMRQYVGENPGRERKQVIDAMIYSNRSKNRDSVAAGLSVVIKQGDIEERDGKLYRAKNK